MCHDGSDANMKVKRPGRCHYSARVQHRRQRSARRSSYRKRR